ncbi:hypothetical protein OVS_01125 [Mycoplasma ovis str. Michigan]|uniref:Uncharacterized protein n=1 Tax=Mycoplasma ovis str. Michigan TaxID=1415773 RepID=A0ABM5P177_9MOLU|nr:hypothetical protein [Mycoplasma ovis]AHC40182.1 hypothetical protein OVS_01125 [Mycoplasma ovis str. Michigan]
MKARLLTTLGFFVAPPATIFPLLWSQDRELKVISLEGSGSLFEPIKHLVKKQKTNAVISVIPTGSTGGKESLSDKSSDLALTSLLDSNGSNNGRKELQLATDPISLVFKKGSKCNQLSLTNGNGGQNGQNNSEFLKKLFEESNNDCQNLILWMREGGQERSNINKTTIDKGQTLKIQVQEAPENNFLALEKFLRESYLDSLIFFPTSFYELNKDLFSDYQTIKLQGQNGKEQQSPKLQKELNLVFSSNDIDQKSDLKAFIKNILLETKGLQNDFKLVPKSYCCCSKGDSTQCGKEHCPNGDSENCKSEDIEKIFKK